MATQPEMDEMLAQFQSITGATDERAKFYLESANGQLDLAVAAFYDQDGEMDTVPPPTTSSTSSSTSGATSSTTRKAASSTNVSSHSNIHQLGHRDDDDGGGSSDDGDQGQAFFAGGSRTSGQQILGPPKKKGHDFVSEMFRRAREQGAEVAEPGGSSSKKKSTFSGTGFKLGSSENDSEVVEDPSSRPNTAEPREFTLKMWNNGFSLDDGPLREYDDDGSNREFLNAILRGRIPLELIKEARGGEVHINMEDHHSEEYVKPKATVRPFQGSGHVLGSIVPPMVVDSKPSTEEEKKQAQSQADDQVKVDESQPTTNLQIRLNDGSRLIVKLNHSHTVGDLRRYIVLARPEYSSAIFGLMTGFPSKELTDDSATLKDAGLLGAAILLRPK